MSRARYFHVTNRKKQVTLLRVPPYVPPGHRVRALVDTGEGRAHWEMSYSTWRRLINAVDRLPTASRPDGVLLDLWWDDVKPILHMAVHP